MPTSDYDSLFAPRYWTQALTPEQRQWLEDLVDEMNRRQMYPNTMKVVSILEEMGVPDVTNTKVKNYLQRQRRVSSD